MKIFNTISLFAFLMAWPVVEINAQSISTSVPEKPDVNTFYLFYLHGGIVQEKGANAVSPNFGKYEYYAILDTLKNEGFNIISEVRPKGTEEKEYAKKVKSQIDTLLSLGVADKNIIIVGASQGAYIALEASVLNDCPNIRFVLMGLCSEYAVKYFLPFQENITGNFLSIYESSDSKRSCLTIFQELRNGSRFKEIKLEMGNSHAFLYKPFKEWVKPLANWVKKE